MSKSSVAKSFDSQLLRISLAVGALALLLYLPTFANFFAHDDHRLLYTGREILAGRTSIFSPILARLRPTYLASFAVTYGLFGTQPLPYTVTHFLLHLLNGLLFGLLVHRVLRSPPKALLGAALFVLNPAISPALFLQTYRDHLLVVFFLYALTLSWLVGEEKPRWRFALRTVSLLLLLLAIGTKATWISILGFLPLCLWLSGYKRARVWKPLLFIPLLGAAALLAEGFLLPRSFESAPHIVQSFLPLFFANAARLLRSWSFLFLPFHAVADSPVFMNGLALVILAAACLWVFRFRAWRKTPLLQFAPAALLIFSIPLFGNAYSGQLFEARLLYYLAPFVALLQAEGLLRLKKFCVEHTKVTRGYQIALATGLTIIVLFAFQREIVRHNRLRNEKFFSEHVRNIAQQFEQAPPPLHETCGVYLVNFPPSKDFYLQYEADAFARLYLSPRASTEMCTTRSQAEIDQALAAPAPAVEISKLAMTCGLQSYVFKSEMRLPDPETPCPEPVTVIYAHGQIYFFAS